MFTSRFQILFPSFIIIFIFSILLANPVQLVAVKPHSNFMTSCLVYVNASASSGGNGSTWDLAYQDLQTALTTAEAVAQCEVWVAKGIYKPSLSLDQNASFTLKNYVEIYGGFEGGETSRSQRDWLANSTILSGDLNGDDGPNFTNITDNSFHVVNADNTSSGSVLDGFTISGGNADFHTGGGGFGGGLHQSTGSMTLANLIFSGNNATVGGGMSNSGNSTLTNVIFSGNRAIYGGGMFNNGNPILTNVTFSSNQADEGGGMENANCAPTLTHVYFLSNSAPNGGGLFNGASHPTLTNVTFVTNHAANGGGGIFDDHSSETLIGVTFDHNTAGRGGGMLIFNESSPSLTNVSFWGNTASIDGGGIFNYSSNPTLTNVTFTKNAAVQNGGGIYNTQNGHPLVRNSILWEDTGGEIYLEKISLLSTFTFTFSLVQGCNPNGSWNPDCDINGGHNLADAHPKFIDPNNGNLDLQISSPVINKGNNTFVNGVSTDLGGNPRIFGGVVDLGAYERSYLSMFLPIMFR